MTLFQRWIIGIIIVGSLILIWGTRWKYSVAHRLRLERCIRTNRYTSKTQTFEHDSSGWKSNK